MSANREQELDQLWLNEALDRLEAYDRGDLEAVSAEEVFAEINEQMANKKKCLTTHPKLNSSS